MSKISARLQKQVIERAKGYCEYCYTSQTIVLAMVVDHIKPESKGGTTTEDNLCYACHLCNGSKHDFETGIDPDTGQEHPLFHPRAQNWQEHFRWSADYSQVIGLTPVGRATIDRLDINRPVAVKARPRWRKINWNPPH